MVGSWLVSPPKFLWSNFFLILKFGTAVSINSVTTILTSAFNFNSKYTFNILQLSLINSGLNKSTKNFLEEKFIEKLINKENISSKMSHSNDCI